MKQKLNELEHEIAQGEITVYQVFSKMRGWINREREAAVYKWRFINHLTSQGVDHEMAQNEAEAYMSDCEMGEPEEDAMDAVSNWDD